MAASSGTNALIAYNKQTRVDVELLRVAFVRSMCDAGAVAKQLGWMQHGGRYADGRRVKRALGISNSYKSGQKYKATTIDMNIAERIAYIIDADYIDVGL